MGQTQEVKMTVTRTCDVCNTSKTMVQTQGEPVDATQLAALEGWYILSKDHVVGEGIAPIGKVACSHSCAITVLENNQLEPPTGANILDFKKVN